MIGYTKKASKLVYFGQHQGDRFPMGFRAAISFSVFEWYLSVCPTDRLYCLPVRKKKKENQATSLPPQEGKNYLHQVLRFTSPTAWEVSFGESRRSLVNTF